MPKCKDCVHVEVCCEKNLHVAVGMNIIPRFKYKRIEQECKHFKDRSRFVELPFTQSKGASPFDKIAHTAHTLATEGRHLVGNTIEGYRVMYNEERLYTIEKDGIVILVHGVAKYDAVQRAKQALEKLLAKERESNE